MTATRINYVTATMLIRGNRTVGFGISDADTVRQAGFKDLLHYWKAALARKMPVHKFVYLLESHLQNPERTAAETRCQIIPLSMEITGALRDAFEANVDWFSAPRSSAGSDVEFNNMLLNPIAAAEWLLSGPMEQALVPMSLTAFLGSRADDSGSMTTPAMGPVNHVQGRPPKKKREVEEKMRAYMANGGDLTKLKQEDLPALFGASRGTCVAVRDDILHLSKSTS